MLRGAEWKQHGHKGRAAWSDQSKAGYSEKMSGANNPAWKGGVTIFKKKGNYSGVRYVRAPTWAQPMARKDGYLMEHRLVMAEWCGYLLTRTEVVHHIDHDPARSPQPLSSNQRNGATVVVSVGVALVCEDQQTRLPVASSAQT